MKLVILTGAGISAESGLLTFRDNDGLWCSHRVEDVATPEAFQRNPKLVHQFYNERRAQLKNVEPNAAHVALAELAARWEGEFLLVTQNVDNLHERAHALHPPKAGFELLHMHGQLTKIRCEVCEAVQHFEEDSCEHDSCIACNQTGYMRPHIVWFGEMPLAMERIYAALQQCDLFVSIGTSGNVYPAAGFVQAVRARRKEAAPALSVSHGASSRRAPETFPKTVELNLEPSLNADMFDEAHYGKASEVVREWVEEFL